MNKTFTVLYDSELVTSDIFICDIIIDGKHAETLEEVRQDLDSKLSLHIITIDGKELLLNQYNVIKIMYNR